MKNQLAMKIPPPVVMKASSVTIKDEYLMYLLNANMNDWIRDLTCILINIIYNSLSRTFYYSHMENQNNVALKL